MEVIKSMTQFQSLDWVIKRTGELFKINPRRSLSASYRYFRKNESLTMLGDYILFRTMLDVVHSLGIKTTRNQLYRVFKQSRELNRTDKMELVNIFTKPICDKRKGQNLPHSKRLSILGQVV